MSKRSLTVRERSEKNIRRAISRKQRAGADLSAVSRAPRLAVEVGE